MVDLDVRLVKSFVAVAEERSFTRAAERLRVAQPWLSVQIRKLEEQLGFRLFERNRNQAVMLSPKAEAFLPFVRDYLLAIERLTAGAQRVRDQGAIMLRLGAPDFSVEMPVRNAVLESFMVQHPKVEVDVANAWTVELLRRLHEGEIDLAFTVGPHVDPHSEAMVLGRYSLSLLLPREHPAADIGEPVSLSLFAGEEIAIFRRNVNPSFHDSIAPILEAAGVHVGYLPETGNSAIIQHAARSLVPVIFGAWQTLARNLPDPLVIIPVDEPAMSFNLNLVRRVGDRRPLVADFWEGGLPFIAG